MMIMQFFSDFLYKGICCGYPFELHRQVDAIQMSTHNICLYKDVKKKYTGCNLKSMEFLDCAFIGVCAVIRSNTVISYQTIPKFLIFMKSTSRASLWSVELQTKNAILQDCFMCNIMHSILQFFHSWLDEMKTIKNQVLKS